MQSLELSRAQPTLLRKRQGVQAARILLVFGLCVYLAGIYTNASIEFLGTNAVGFIALIGAIVMLLARPVALRSGGARRLALLLAFLAIFTVVGDSALFGERFNSYLQIFAALFCLHVVLNTTDQIGQKDFGRVLGYATLFVVLGTTAEVLVPDVRELSDSFRYTVFADRFIYDSVGRDLATYGAVRPKFFTQEPSHVAKAFLCFGASWYLLSNHRYKAALLSVGTLLLLLYLRSPFVLLTLPLAVALDYLKQGFRRIVLFAILALPAFAIMAFAGLEFFATRLEIVQAGKDFSFFSRLVGPYQIALLSWQDTFFFGVGLGGKESLLPYFLEAYSGWSSTSYLREIYLDFFNNAAANSLAYFGIIGASLFYWLLWRYFRNSVVSLAVILLFFQLDGALEGIRMWAYIAILIAAYDMSKKSSGKQIGHSDRQTASSRRA